MNKLTRQIVNFVCVFSVVFSAWLKAEGADAGLQRFNFERVEMGVIFRLSVYGSDSGVANKAAEAAYARVRELNGIFSDYEGTSEVRRLCETSGPGRPVKVSDELFTVLEASLRLSRATRGAFDVTVGPLTKLWRRARRREVMPTPERLAAERKLIGHHLVRLDPESKSVELLREGMRIDFGGIAKGFAADEALRVLAEHGFNRSLVDASGDIVAGDPPPCSDAWVVSIESLRRRSVGRESPEQEVGGSQEDRKPETIPMLRICNQAVATSGDAYQSVVIDGRRYSHIVDPKTGLGLNQRSSVTIIAPTGMMADALASAVRVLGPSAGIELLEQPGSCDTAGYVMFAKEEFDEVRTVTSSGLGRFLIREPHEK
jgi:thiamine biosynthesis lipoprotein